MIWIFGVSSEMQRGAMMEPLPPLIPFNLFPVQKTATDPQSLLNHNRVIGSKYFENHFLWVRLQLNQQLKRICLF